MVHFRLHPRKKYKHSVEVNVENTIIKPLDVTRYLAVIIDKQLKWRNHLQHLESKMAGRISLLRYLAKSAQERNQKTMISIFKVIARLVMTYEYPILLTANDKPADLYVCRICTSDIENIEGQRICNITASQVY
ncbi:unnamed protein product [Adineta ricciae]|uniref:Uncharacterized protein n=1 Tax=Adineta ricciae TaxID=249248 RepID=A0A815RM46_ADIRI|nr:unnamed protein product [Adineta ricciae]